MKLTRKQKQLMYESFGICEDLIDVLQEIKEEFDSIHLERKPTVPEELDILLLEKNICSNKYLMLYFGEMLEFEEENPDHFPYGETEDVKIKGDEFRVEYTREINNED